MTTIHALSSSQRLIASKFWNAVLNSISYYYENGYGAYVKEITTSLWWHLSTQCNPWAFNERNSHTIVHRYSKKVAPLYSSNIKVNREWKRNKTEPICHVFADISPPTVYNEKHSIKEVIDCVKKQKENVSCQIEFCRKMAAFATDGEHF